MPLSSESLARLSVQRDRMPRDLSEIRQAVARGLKSILKRAL
jgi:hypothetical protein